MKKIAVFLVLIGITLMGCASRNEAKDTEAKPAAVLNVTAFKYSAVTRGAQKEATITKVNISVTENRRTGKIIEATYPIGKENWDRLVAMAQTADPEKQLENYKAPSNKYRHDGAMAANLTITVGDTEYSSVTFDDGNPPAEIKELVQEIIGISGLGKIQVQE